MFDVVIIGAGVVGALIARLLSQYKLRVALLDKEEDVSEGSSKANSGIVHAGYDAKPGSLKAELNIRGNNLMKDIVSELSVDYSPTGSLVVAFDNDELQIIRDLYDRGLANRVPDMKLILSQDKLKDLEPMINDEAQGALYAPTAGIICPYGLTIAACENAVENGIQLMLGTKVLDIKYRENVFIIQTSNGILESRFIINAAGLYADEISAMVEERWFSIKPRRGEYLILDKRCRGLAQHTLFGTPSKMGKGVLVTPTVDGNILIGPTSDDQTDKTITDTTREGMDQIIERAQKLIPDINQRDVITSFAGLRAVSDKGDFIIQASDQVYGLIHAAGIESPGLTAAPAIAERILELLVNQGLRLERKTDYNPIRKPITYFKELSDDDKEKIIRDNSLYGHIVCRCETVTEAEVIESIRRPVGAKNLDGVKRRVRAGMGRCQGGFCSPRITEILARELGVPMEAITKKGSSSKILSGKLKDQAYGGGAYEG